MFASDPCLSKFLCLSIKISHASLSLQSCLEAAVCIEEINSFLRVEKVSWSGTDIGEGLVFWYRQMRRSDGLVQTILAKEQKIESLLVELVVGVFLRIFASTVHSPVVWSRLLCPHVQ